MTSSVERKQYDWRADAERSLFNMASTVGHSDRGHLNETAAVTLISVIGFCTKRVRSVNKTTSFPQ